MKKILILLLLFLLTSCQKNDVIGNSIPESREGFYFDTIIQISIYGEKKEVAQSALDECFELAKELEKTLSTTIDSSDISKINNNSPEFVEVSKDTIFLLKKAIFFGDKSSGVFDVTMGDITSMWDFNGDGVLPNLDIISKKLPYVNYKNIEIKNNRARLSEPDSSIDLGGIAKGYIADKMRALLISKGITSAIINLGGNINTIGVKPDGKDFNVGIQDPLLDDGEAIAIMNATDMSIVTSGTYQRYFDFEGVRYHHILDKETGMPIQNGLSSVTIVTESSTDADALSTICFLLGKKDGLALIESLDGTEAMFIDDNDKISYSSGCENYINTLFK